MGKIRNNNEITKDSWTLVMLTTALEEKRGPQNNGSYGVFWIYFVARQTFNYYKLLLLLTFVLFLLVSDHPGRCTLKNSKPRTRALQLISASVMHLIPIKVVLFGSKKFFGQI